MNRKIIDYITINHCVGTAFDTLIKAYLKEGYELYGNPYSLHGGETFEGDFDLEGYFCQAMVKYEQIIDKIFEGAI